MSSMYHSPLRIGLFMAGVLEGTQLPVGVPKPQPAIDGRAGRAAQNVDLPWGLLATDLGEHVRGDELGVGRVCLEGEVLPGGEQVPVVDADAPVPTLAAQRSEVVGERPE